MTAEVPRRLRPRADQRTKTILTKTKGAPSSQGAVSSARPVTTNRRATIYAPKAVSNVLTGSGTPDATSITSTDVTGAGSSDAGGAASIAIGGLSTAGGTATVTIGYDATASGGYSVRIGFAGLVSGTNGVGIGTAITATGDSAVAVGYSAHGTGAFATAVGRNTVASAGSATAIGNEASVVSAAGVALGQSATVFTGATASIAIGYRAEADASNAVVIGTGCLDQGTGDNVVIGQNGRSNGWRGVCIGQANADGNRSISIGDTGGARSNNAVVLGYGAIVGGVSGSGTPLTDAQDGVAIGTDAYSGAPSTVAIGNGASVNHGACDNSVAIGKNATTSNKGTMALGCDSAGNGAATSADNEIALGTANHIAIVKGKLVIADNVGGLHQIVVSTGGALSTVAYP